MPLNDNIRAEFYTHFRGEPYFNMGFDEWMLSRVTRHPEQILLRFYTWSTGTITIGFNQQAERAVNLERLGGTPLIRRITGGRAIYHDSAELTYSLALNTERFKGHPLGGKVSEVSRQIALTFVSFLRRLKVPAEYVRKSHRENARPGFFNKAPCFESMAKYELAVRGRKVVASAQKRYRDCLLQHGSIKLFGPAPHPALNGDGTGRFCDPKVIGGEDFKMYGDVFLREFAEVLGISFEITKEPNEGTSEVVKYATNVKKNYLNKRDLLNK